MHKKFHGDNCPAEENENPPLTRTEIEKAQRLNDFFNDVPVDDGTACISPMESTEDDSTASYLKWCDELDAAVADSTDEGSNDFLDDLVDGEDVAHALVRGGGLCNNQPISQERREQIERLVQLQGMQTQRWREMVRARNELSKWRSAYLKMWAGRCDPEIEKAVAEAEVEVFGISEREWEALSLDEQAKRERPSFDILTSAHRSVRGAITNKIKEGRRRDAKAKDQGRKIVRRENLDHLTEEEKKKRKSEQGKRRVEKSRAKKKAAKQMLAKASNPNFGRFA